jgi:hypothetical protein
MGTHDQPHEDALFSEKELPRYQAEQRVGTYCFMSKSFLLIVLLLVVVLPIGMGHMVDCPACTPAKGHSALGLCVGILSLIALIVVFSSSR